MGRVKLPKDTKKKEKLNNANQKKNLGGTVNTQTQEHAPKEFKGKGGYHHVQKGKMLATEHPLLKEYEGKWKCKKCAKGVAGVTVTQFDVKFEGGEFGKTIEKWKVTCQCGWKAQCDQVHGPGKN